MAKKKETGKITLEQFLSWLQGVEDMQEDNWVPNKEQWKRIRDKVQCIYVPEQEDVRVVGPQYQQPFNQGGPAVIFQPQFEQMNMMPPKSPPNPLQPDASGILPVPEKSEFE